MPKKIIKINFEIPGDESKVISLKSELSLLDYDIAIVDPNISEFYGFGDVDYLGKPSLSDTDSFRLKERIKHWRREILETIKAGNNVFILLNALQDVWVKTGAKEFSGTGRNRQITHIVEPFNNYEIIPAGLKVVNSNGNNMRLAEKENLLASYWAELGTESEYRVFVERKGLKPLVKTKSGEKIVGAYGHYKGGTGAIVLLPYLDFERDEFYFEKDGNMFWADEAVEIGMKFISSIIGLDKALRETSESTPIPNWAEQELFVLPQEKVIRKKLLTLEMKINTLQEEREQLEQNLADEISLKNLLFEKGKILELSILDALKLVGFSASQYKDSTSEFDAVFESKEGRFLGEAEGRDKKAISIDKLRQLEMNILEDFERDEIDKIAKGVLFGNAQRLLPPDERVDFFTQKCLIAANRSDTALVKTVDLFIVAKYLSAKKNIPFAKKCREAILGATGIVIFPDIPEKNLKVKNVIAESIGGNK